ncbi:GvpL/GvpF family gas vesicle protein [Nitriliruptor alkaliphilus]|uniref:GvpL/GvpF family gas vesicle protein n=1 Tax=Nitriliruptor alkaliphilus TaxID=427918 RepID=UPI0006983637|nr:GvpL/GvpF family gas vesicle protein [Nitriliruptor alkaliphilus]
MAYLVHAVTRELPDDTGDDRPPLETVVDGELVGVASRIDGDEALPTRANLLHHTQVLEHLAQHTTVLPMRFGVVVPHLDAIVDDFLHPERHRLRATLDRLEGHVELRLRGRYEEARVIRAVLDDDPGAERLRGRRSTEAKMELGERIVAGIERRREHDTARVIEALRPYVAGISEGPITVPLDAFSLSFLVSNEGRPDFEEAVDRVAETLAPLVKFELVGPLPPFSFTDTTASTWA